MRRNLLDVLTKLIPTACRAIAEIYAENVVWHEPDRISAAQGPRNPRCRATSAKPGLGFRPDAPSRSWTTSPPRLHLRPAGQTRAVRDDIAHCEDGVIVEFYTFVN